MEVDFDLKFANGIDLITAERARQMRAKPMGEGYTPEHDRGHGTELALAAATYATPAEFREKEPHSQLPQPKTWPWHTDFWKPDTTGSRRGRIRELQKAGALIAAAIDAERQAVLEEEALKRNG